MRTIQFFGKTSDCFGATIYEDGKRIKDLDGYPPAFLGHDGISMTVDLETGQILNWNKEKVKLEVEEILAQEK